MILFNFNGKENLCEYIKDGVKYSVLATEFGLEGDKYGVYNQCSKEFLKHLSKDLIIYDLKTVEILMSGISDEFLSRISRIPPAQRSSWGMNAKIYE